MASLRDGGLIDVGSQSLAFILFQSSWMTCLSKVFPTIQLALDRPYSYLILSTKAIPEISRTPDLLAPLLSPPYANAHAQPTYVLMQNGLNVEVDLYNALKKLKPQEEPRIISTAVWIATNMLAKNVVEHADFVTKIFATLYSSRFDIDGFHLFRIVYLWDFTDPRTVREMSQERMKTSWPISMPCYLREEVRRRLSPISNGSNSPRTSGTLSSVDPPH